MPIPAETTIRPDSVPHLVAQWLGVTAGPVVVLTVLTLSYAAMTTRCTEPDRSIAWTFLVTGYVVTAACAVLSFLQWRRARSVDGTAARRTRFMGVCGLALNAFAWILLAGFALPHFFLRPCE